VTANPFTSATPIPRSHRNDAIGLSVSTNPPTPQTPLFLARTIIHPTGAARFFFRAPRLWRPVRFAGAEGSLFDYSRTFGLLLCDRRFPTRSGGYQVRRSLSRHPRLGSILRFSRFRSILSSTTSWSSYLPFPSPPQSPSHGTFHSHKNLIRVRPSHHTPPGNPLHIVSSVFRVQRRPPALRGSFTPKRLDKLIIRVIPVSATPASPATGRVFSVFDQHRIFAHNLFTVPGRSLECLA